MVRAVHLGAGLAGVLDVVGQGVAPLAVERVEEERPGVQDTDGPAGQAAGARGGQGLDGR